MSYKVVNSVKKINWVIGRDGRVRKMHPSEKSVLRELADEAREPDLVLQLGAAALARACSLSVRSVRYALATLVRSGHISRRVEAIGETAVTKVHPQLQAPAGPLFRDQPMDNDRAAGTAPEPPPAPDLGDDVAQVFTAWNDMAARASLPGPVAPDAARDAAVARALAEQKLWRVLAAIRRIPDSDHLCGRNRRPGQGDWRASFDWVFKVERYAGLANLRKLLEGNYHHGAAVPLEEPAEAAPARQAAEVAPELAPFVAALRERVGERQWGTWLAAVRWHRNGEMLIGEAPSAFLADWIANNLGEKVRGVALRELPGIAQVSMRVAREMAPA